MFNSIKYLLIALQFLTILPITIKKEIKDQDYGKSLMFFPVVGMFIGTLLGFVSLSYKFLPMMVVAVIILIISAIITGAIHLDGFADTCDSFYGSKSKEEILRIMRDSRVGAMGVIGIVFLLLFKISLIISLSKVVLWQTLIASCCFARWIQVLACLIPYARNEGKAKFFIQYVSKQDIIMGGIFVLILFNILLGLNGFIIFFASLIPCLIFIKYVKAKIGGMTGDTIGSISEIAEISVLFCMLIIF